MNNAIQKKMNNAKWIMQFKRKLNNAIQNE